MTPSRVKALSADERERLEAIAQEMLNVRFMFWSLRHRNRTEDPYDLTEPEFVALETLAHRDVCTVGELQQVLDVRPAQMSRIVRALENKADKPFITCAINPQDKRRINVSLSDFGRRVQEEYKRRRLTANMELIMGLSESEQLEIRKLLNRFRQIMSEQLQKRSG